MEGVKQFLVSNFLLHLHEIFILKSRDSKELRVDRGKQQSYGILWSFFHVKWQHCEDYESILFSTWNCNINSVDYLVSYQQNHLTLRCAGRREKSLSLCLVSFHSLFRLFNACHFKSRQQHIFSLQSIFCLLLLLSFNESFNVKERNFSPFSERY